MTAIVMAVFSDHSARFFFVLPIDLRTAQTEYARIRPANAGNKKPRRTGVFRFNLLRVYAAWMFEACLPFWPSVTSKLTRWFSCSVLKPPA